MSSALAPDFNHKQQLVKISLAFLCGAANRAYCNYVQRESRMEYHLFSRGRVTLATRFTARGSSLDCPVYGSRAWRHRLLLYSLPQLIDAVLVLNYAYICSNEGEGL